MRTRKANLAVWAEPAHVEARSGHQGVFHSFLFACSCHRLSWDQENLFWKCLTAETTCSRLWTRGSVLSDYFCTVWCLTSCWLEKMKLLFSSHIVHRQVPVACQALVSCFFQPFTRDILRQCLSLTDEWTLATYTYEDITDGYISASRALYVVCLSQSH